MFKKKLKNPVMTIRPPVEINKEYSDIVIQIGKFELELADMLKAEDRISIRRNEIEKAKFELLEKVSELSFEMNEAQKQAAIKKQETKSQPTQAPQVTQ